MNIYFALTTRLSKDNGQAYGNKNQLGILET